MQLNIEATFVCMSFLSMCVYTCTHMHVVCALLVNVAYLCMYLEARAGLPVFFRFSLLTCLLPSQETNLDICFFYIPI